MASYPSSFTFDGVQYNYERILKDDFFSVNVLYRAESGAAKVLKIGDFRFIGGFLLRPFAALMNRHELKLYKKLGDIPGIPGAGPSYGWRGFFHEYVEGQTINTLDDHPIKPEFFDELHAMMRAIHAKNVIYLDSNKRGNIILGTDGRPHLIDFQISINFGWVRPSSAWLFNILVSEDIYHVYKHRRHFGCLAPEEAHLAMRSKVNTAVGSGIGKPYRWLKRKIYPQGSNETIWYRWKKEKDSAPRVE